MPNSDFLIIGSGIAGLTFAVKVAQACPDKKVTIITKADESESNTKYAQGGIAVVLNENDSFDKHVEDTLRAGDGLCDLEVVNMVIKEGPERLKEIIEIGARFDVNYSGGFDLGKEGGHSENRIVHHKDITGYEIERALLHKIYTTSNIEIYSHHFAIDLITEHQIKKKVTEPNPDLTCYGAYVLNQKTGKIEKYTANITMLASGGTGQVYGHTTNPLIATGDGIAMAYRAKAKIKDMEFIQFHPTALYEPGGVSPSFLISEAVRGFGAKLKTRKGKAFMHKYDERKELASRDIVSKAIDNELKNSGDDYVCLDCTHLDIELFKQHFPNIYKKCQGIGIDISKELIPVVPASHYLCGGISVNEHGQTSIKNLFACGECSHTGLHGANRLASNSLLEALVYAERSYKKVIKDIVDIVPPGEIPEWNEEGTTEPDELVLITHNRMELQAVMRDYVGIVRSDKRLNRALKRLHLLYKETEELYDTTKVSPQLCELRNLITIGYLIVKQSIARTENKGAYYNKNLD
ncbi:L-aspartate oxidase [Fulvivirgaceae bacterium BMA10]|uniref:L-aspartate oxidase n=1 Tax=Splendidivirga corallicola TaxID=3051826 RepID=A0ABT8KMW2_9BACT|nr:L-aspartate oxidase [Fulvivirgaceae bacterium BMA10]